MVRWHDFLPVDLIVVVVGFAFFFFPPFLFLSCVVLVRCLYFCTCAILMPTCSYELSLT